VAEVAPGYGGGGVTAAVANGEEGDAEAALIASGSGGGAAAPVTRRLAYRVNRRSRWCHRTQVAIAGIALAA
jgi:hypothetical protein